MSAKDAGSTFLAGVLAKLPAEARAQAEAIFKTPEAEAAITLIGDGALARSDYSKHMDDLQTKVDELETLRQQHVDWYAKNKPALDLYVKYEAKIKELDGGTPTPTPTVTPPAGLTKEDVEAALESRDRSFAGALGLGVTLATKHLHMFNEVLDVNTLLANPKLGRPLTGQPGRVFGLQDAYDEAHGTRVQTKAQEAEAARIQKLVDEQLALERKKSPQLPGPMRDASPSIDALLQKPDPNVPNPYTADAAAEEYNRLQQVRNGAVV